MCKTHYFEMWCYKVLPLVYDESLSYYEILCKVVEYINNLIDQDKIIGDKLNDLKKELDAVNKWIDDFDTSYIEKIVTQYLSTMIFVEISNSGYIIYNIPENWESITFRHYA